MSLFFLLLAAHALCDFALQGEVMGRGKSRRKALEQPPRPDDDFPPWYYWLAAHGLIHGGAVALLTGSLFLGVLETVLHTAIDHLKCERKLSFDQDQALHVGCKLLYVFLV
ncbi:MAG: DUF3307 domain-containing protein [Myxococcota bacterium]